MRHLYRGRVEMKREWEERRKRVEEESARLEREKVAGERRRREECGRCGERGEGREEREGLECDNGHGEERPRELFPYK